MTESTMMHKHLCPKSNDINAQKIPRKKGLLGIYIDSISLVVGNFVDGLAILKFNVPPRFSNLILV